MSKEERKENLGKEDVEGLKAFEAALAALVPRTYRLDRDRLMFLAGQQSRIGFQPVEQSRVGQAERSPTNYGEKTHGGTALRLSHPTATAWAWPAAFSAMTAVAAALAIMLAIRPTGPTAGVHPSAIAANQGKNAKPSAAASPKENVAAEPHDLESGRGAANQSSSPLFAFLNSFEKLANADTTAAADVANPDSASLSYPQLRDRVLHNGLDSWQIAQSNFRNHSPALPGPATQRDMLKELLPQMQ
jgi:hypothetical protein